MFILLFVATFFLAAFDASLECNNDKNVAAVCDALSMIVLTQKPAVTCDEKEEEKGERRSEVIETGKAAG